MTVCNDFHWFKVGGEENEHEACGVLISGLDILDGCVYAVHT